MQFLFVFVFVFFVLYSITTGHDLQCCKKLESKIYRNTALLKELLRRHPKGMYNLYSVLQEVFLSGITVVVKIPVLNAR